MGNGKTGAKAGLIAGLLYGIISGVGSYALLIVYKAQVMKSLSASITSAEKSIGLTATSLYSIQLNTAIIGGIIGGLIIGLILGHIYKKLPGKSDILKGVSFGIILWIIFNVGIGALNIKTLGITYYISSVGIGIIGVIVYGYLLGYFFGKWNGDTVEHLDENIQQ